MKICIIGSGHIGAGLARAWVGKGHAVVFGARSPEKPELVEICRSIGASAATIAAGVEHAEVVVIAAPFAALDDVLASSGDLAGKVVVDCTNAVQKGMTLKYGHTTSAAEELQARLPAAHVFKSFNAQGAENLAAPVYGDVRASNFFCGDDAAGRVVVQKLVEDVGFEAIDAGPLRNARLLEPMMLLWVTCAQSLGTRDIAFKLLRR
jgi:8-hydroxy-5-deazaflavin:NADPH oxidoreductase